MITLALIGGLLIAAAAPSPAWADRRGGYWQRNYGGNGNGYYGGNVSYSPNSNNQDNGFGPTVPNTKFDNRYWRNYYGRYRNGNNGGHEGDNRNLDNGFGPTIPK
jgi:hypothetical protein